MLRSGLIVASATVADTALYILPIKPFRVWPHLFHALSEKPYA